MSILSLDVPAAAVAAPGVATPAGPNGASAYGLAVLLGYGGTLAQWIASLQGTKGDGGDPGKDAFQVAVDAGFTGTRAQWVQSLVGPKGATIITGLVPPASSDGRDGDFWIESRTAAGLGRRMYGPKGNGAWSGTPWPIEVAEYTDVPGLADAFAVLTQATLEGLAAKLAAANNLADLTDPGLALANLNALDRRILKLASDPGTSDIAAGTIRVAKNTATGRLSLWANDGGVLVDLLTFNAAS